MRNIYLFGDMFTETNLIFGSISQLIFSKSNTPKYPIGVRPHFTCPGHSSTNGLAERAIQTIDQKERTYRIKHGKPEEFWALSWETATHLSNVVVWQYLGKYHLDSYTDYYWRTWDYSLLQEPLSKCFATIRDRLKTEEVQKSTIAIFGSMAVKSMENF